MNVGSYSLIKAWLTQHINNMIFATLGKWDLF